MNVNQKPKPSVVVTQSVLIPMEATTVTVIQGIAEMETRVQVYLPLCLCTVSI